MADNPRIEDLRRRVQKDPASIAFAQLAEECRRVGQNEESIEVCRAGLAIHPGYLSARVTLGRALLEVNQLDEAQVALELVLKSAAENLAAIRGLAEIHHRRGSLPEALAQYRAALALARNDPDLQRTVADLARVVEPPAAPASDDGLSFEQMQNELLEHSPSPQPVVGLTPDTTAALAPDETTVLRLAPDMTDALTLDTTTGQLEPHVGDTLAPDPTEETLTPDIADVAGDPGRSSVGAFAFLQDSAAPPLQLGEDTAARQLAMQTIAALERWLDAIHVARAQRIA